MDEIKRIQKNTKSIYGEAALKNTNFKMFNGSPLIQSFDNPKNVGSLVAEANPKYTTKNISSFKGAGSLIPNPKLTFTVISNAAPSLIDLQYLIRDFIETWDTGSALYVWGDNSLERKEGLNIEASKDLGQPIRGYCVKLIDTAYQNKLDYESIQLQLLNAKVAQSYKTGRVKTTKEAKDYITKLSLKFKNRKKKK